MKTEPTARELIEAASVPYKLDYQLDAPREAAQQALDRRARDSFALALEALETCRNEFDLRPPFFGDSMEKVRRALAAMDGRSEK